MTSHNKGSNGDSRDNFKRSNTSFRIGGGRDSPDDVRNTHHQTEVDDSDNDSDWGLEDPELVSVGGENNKNGKKSNQMERMSIMTMDMDPKD